MSDRGFRALLFATLAVFVAMFLASPTSCSGIWVLCSFDAQLLPYAPDTARAYLKAVEPALWRYLWIAQPLDLAFPALLCLALREAFMRWTPARSAARFGRIAVAYAGIDYLENAAIRVMLHHPSGDFSDLVARAASALTTVKWLVLAVLFATLARALVVRRAGVM